MYFRQMHCIAQITMHETYYIIIIYTKTISAGCVYTQNPFALKYTKQSTESKIQFYNLPNEPYFSEVPSKS